MGWFGKDKAPVSKLAEALTAMMMQTIEMLGQTFINELLSEKEVKSFKMDKAFFALLALKAFDLRRALSSERLEELIHPAVRKEIEVGAVAGA